MAELEQSWTHEARRARQRKRWEVERPTKDVVHCPKSQNDLRTHHYKDVLEYIRGFNRPMRCKYCKDLKDGSTSPPEKNINRRRRRARNKIVSEAQRQERERGS